MSVMKRMAVTADQYAYELETAVSDTGASSTPDNTWHDIEWRKVNREVQRLQARIVQATKANRWGKVKALQRLLTRSFSGKALAVKRVTENCHRQVHSRGLTVSKPQPYKGAVCPA